MLKATAAELLYRSGLLSLWQRVVLRNRLVVLMYHRVLPPEEMAATASHPGIIVSRDTFAAQMKLLQRRFVLLSAADVSERVGRGQPFPSSACLVTFDDGWIDNFTTAFPILRARDIPAIVFLPVNYIGTGRLFWRESLAHLLAKAVEVVRLEPQRAPAVATALKGLGIDFDPARAQPWTLAEISQQLDPLKSRSACDLEKLVASLAAVLGVDRYGLSVVDRFMTWEQVKTMIPGRVDFGGHGAEHVLLTRVPEDELEREARQSWQVLEGELGSPRPMFSYPNGSWNAAVATIVRRAGFQLAFTTEPGAVRAGDEPGSLRRVNISEDATRTDALFLARVLGLF